MPLKGTLIRNPGTSRAPFKLFPVRNEPSLVPKDVKKTFFLKGPYYTYIIFEVLEVFEK